METPPRRRRSKSVKNILSTRARRDSVLEAEDSLPPPPYTPSKPSLVQLHVTADDLGLKPLAPRPHTSSLAVPSARNTWPQGLREQRPGAYAFRETPTLVRTPWEQDRRLRSAPTRRPRSTTSSSLDSETFARLPREILHCVLDHLRNSRCSGAQLNVLSYRNDLRKLCITNKQWHRVAREHLYQEIWLPSSSSLRSNRVHLAHATSRGTSRLRSLLRTLEEAPGLAHLVKRLHIPSAMVAEFDLVIYIDAQQTKGFFSESILSTLCNIIRRCPNFQALSGHHALACDRTTELLDALASRPKLKEHVWNLPRTPSDWQILVRPGAFIDHHVQWRHLETLAIWEDNSRSDRLGQGTLTAVLQRLPSLKHLMLKGLSRSEFHNGTLLMLPALRSLRLEDVPGITDHGLQQLVHTRLAMSLESFSLIGLELTALRTIQTLLANLPRLKRFSLIQKTSPELEQVFSFTGTSFSLGSQTLEHLHWNALLAGNATAILAKSIAAGKFPSLRSVKIPCDYEGVVQKLCRPIQQRKLSDDELGSHIEDFNFSGLQYRETTDCLEIAAQIRAKRARKDSVFSVTVDDEEGVQQFQWHGSYLGNIASKIEYCLEPDVEGQLCSHARIQDLSRPPRLEGGFEQVVGLDVLF